jgi:hypothetical protein
MRFSYHGCDSLRTRKKNTNPPTIKTAQTPIKSQGGEAVSVGGKVGTVLAAFIYKGA